MYPDFDICGDAIVILQTKFFNVLSIVDDKSCDPLYTKINWGMEINSLFYASFFLQSFYVLTCLILCSQKNNRFVN